MAQDTTPAIVVYQGTGSDAPFSIPFDKGYYGEIKVLFVRRGLADYTYYPDTYVVSGRLYAWQNGNTRVFTHTPRPAVGAVIYTDEDVAPVTSITLKDLSDNQNIYLRSAEDDVLVRRLYAWKHENIIVYTDTPTPTLSSVVTDYQWHELPLRIVSLTNIVVSAISGQTITVDEVIYTRAVQHDISNNLLLTWTGDTLEVGDFICIIRDTERGQPYEMPINQKHVEFALDNLERQIQELKDATDSALKVDPSYDIEDSHKMNPIQWLETILRSMDKSVRAFRYADGWLDYSLDDPNIAEISKTWRHLLSTENIKNIREASRVLDDKIIYWTEYQDREGNWKTLCKSDEWDSKIDEALEISQEAKDTADEAKEIATNAQTVAGQAKDIAEDAKETAEGIEGIAQEALDKVTQEITDREDADEDLQDQIDSLSGRGRFLALWNCATGLAESNPPESPYPYKAGDYFVVGTVSSADPAVNYRPDGSSYTTGVASTTVETNEVSVNDTYFYDGTTWKLQSNAQKEVSFSALAGSPYDNTNLSNALNSKQDTLTAGTNITIENDVISSTSTESFFRGPFANWASVPTTVDNYYPDIYGNKTPRNTDYIIIEDASQVPAGGNTVSMTMRTDAYGAYPTQELTTVIGSESYTGTGIFGEGEIEVKSGVVVGGWYCVVWKNLKNEVVFGGTTYPIGSDFNIVRIQPPFSGTSTATLGISYPYSGTWRFGYRGQWNLEGRGGWKGEYAVEETLPIADDQTLGIAKLYTTTGQNTDGSMTQKSITDALDTKANSADLATVATTGDYDDLLNKPTIPAAQVNSDWNANSGVAQILNKPTLATVATSGSYNDLSNKPTIPTVNNATLTIQKNGTTVQTFTANQSTNATANISVPTKTSDITNDSGFITSSALAPYALSADLATVATSGSYNDLSDKPTIPTVNNSTITITQGGVTKGSFTLNQATGDTIALDAGGGGGSVDIDNTTITKNSDDEIQAVAVIDQNTGIAKTWTGTMAEYEAIVTKDPETEYIITDDIGGSATEIGEITEDINDLKEHTVIEFQEPTAGNNYTWYRLYSDGWVEQGGLCSGTAENNPVTMPIEMSNTEYQILAISDPTDSVNSWGWIVVVRNTKTTTGFSLGGRYGSGSVVPVRTHWQVSGMAA